MAFMPNKGFIALTAVVMVSLACLFVVTLASLDAVSLENIYVRNTERIDAFNRARSCISVGIAKAASDLLYQGNEFEHLSAGDCKIGAVSYSDSVLTIDATATTSFFAAGLHGALDHLTGSIDISIKK